MNKRFRRNYGNSFLKELDALAIGTVDFQCLGGFVVTQLYGLNRSTGDLDVLSIAPVEQRKEFLEKSRQGLGSPQKIQDLFGLRWSRFNSVRI